MTGRKLTWILMVLVVLSLLCGCSRTSQTKAAADPGEEAKVLTVVWQHSPEGQGTRCEKCLSKKNEILKACESLKNSLSPLGIKVAMKQEPAGTMPYDKAVSQSSKISVGGRMLEEWLGAELVPGTCGKGCSQAGGTVQCASVQLAGQIYEVVPADLIVKAGLIAASEMLGTKGSKTCPMSRSCPKKTASGCGQ